MTDINKAIEEIKYILDIISELQDLVNYIRKNNLTIEQFFTMYNNDDIYLFYKLVSILRINRYDFYYMRHYRNLLNTKELKKRLYTIFDIYSKYNYINHNKDFVYNDLINTGNDILCDIEYKGLLEAYDFWKKNK